MNIGTEINEIQKIESIPIDYTWSFSDKTIKDTAYLTHSYYTYPAKFIPQLVSRLMTQYSNENDLIVDPFMGSGTTIVEAILKNRKSLGVDINPIAKLVSKVKTTPLDIKKLKSEHEVLINKLSDTYDDKESFFNQTNTLDILEKSKSRMVKNERIDYWFKQSQKDDLSIILYHILDIEDEDIKDFYLIAFAQILKSTSIWLQKSVKPTRDFNKKDVDAIKLFISKTNSMIKKHDSFNQHLSSDVLNNINEYRKVFCSDSRKVPLEDLEASMIITSPPYVTSYEYADLHQLPSLWFGYLEDLPNFRKNFIGSRYKTHEKVDLKSSLAYETISKFEGVKKSDELYSYYADMLESFVEMKRILKPHGIAAIVIGNTKYKNIDILNAEIFIEQMNNIGFSTKEIIHREIPSKMLPTTRDEKTGRFAKVADSTSIVYPTEYILIMERL